MGFKGVDLGQSEVYAENFYYQMGTGIKQTPRREKFVKEDWLMILILFIVYKWISQSKMSSFHFFLDGKHSLLFCRRIEV